MLRHFTHKHKTNHKETTARTFAYLELFKSFAIAAFCTVFPIILYQKIGTEDYVGYYNSVIAFVGLLTCILSSYIFCKYPKALVTKITLIIAVLSFILMTMATNIWSLMSLDIPRAISLAIATIAISLYIGDYSNDEDLPVNEARYYLYANIGWFLGPLVAGFSALYFGNESVFILCSLSLGISLLYFLHQHLIASHPGITDDKDDVHDEKISELFSSIKEYFTDLERFKVFLIAFGVNFSWSSLVYVLIAVKMMGYGMGAVGLIAALRCLPLILLEPAIGKLAGKHGVRRYIVIGFFLSSMMTFSFVFLDGITLLAMFCLVNIGMAFVEPLQETYFFQVVSGKRKREKFFGIYNTADPMVHLTMPIIASIILIFSTGFDALWVFYGCGLLLFSGLTLTIKPKK